jgi:hypothetical protein
LKRKAIFEPKVDLYPSLADCLLELGETLAMLFFLVGSVNRAQMWRQNQGTDPLTKGHLEHCQ